MQSTRPRSFTPCNVLRYERVDTLSSKVILARLVQIHFLFNLRKKKRDESLVRLLHLRTTSGNRSTVCFSWLERISMTVQRQYERQSRSVKKNDLFFSSPHDSSATLTPALATFHHCSCHEMGELLE
jgi:hypothetical protein